MIIYNITTKVDVSIAGEWLTWIKDEHIPDLINTGCFTKAAILKLLDVDDSDGPTYAIQFFTEKISMYNLYISKYAGIMRQRSFEKWGNKFIAIRSLMEFVH